ncbi:LOW QUALITY PROTEIN: zf-RVT domain-containing protein, partial [Cephalotus follicularis]
LPVKYLGLPLISTRLTKQDCAPLIEKIMARVNSWISKSLSYAGRSQLIKSTLASMVFWSSIFSLPTAVIKECKRSMRGQIWNLLTDHTLWVQWCKKNLIRKHSFWSLPFAGYYSWSWRHISLLRNLALQHLIYVCGKGDRFSLWYDPWFHGTSIHALYGHRVIYDAGIQGTELVQSVIAHEQWNWPATSSQLREIQHRVQDIRISSAMDQIFWDSEGKLFTTKAAWKSIRVPAPAEGWARLVWHHSRIPKDAFYLGLSILRALKTRDKLLLLGLVPSASCSFNYGEDETIEHLFFTCPYT